MKPVTIRQYNESTRSSFKITLFPKPGCRVMKASGPSRYHRIWAPNVWMSRNEEEGLSTARSPVTKGTASLWPFSVTVPEGNNISCNQSECIQHIRSKSPRCSMVSTIKTCLCFDCTKMLHYDASCSLQGCKKKFLQKYQKPQARTFAPCSLQQLHENMLLFFVNNWLIYISHFLKNLIQFS